MIKKKISLIILIAFGLLGSSCGENSIFSTPTPEPTSTPTPVPSPTPTPEELFSSTIFLGDSALEKRDYSKAIQLYGSAYIYREGTTETNSFRMTSIVERKLGNVFSFKKEYRKAMAYYADSMRSAEKGDSDLLFAHSAYNMSLSELNHGWREDAIWGFIIEEAQLGSAENHLNQAYRAVQKTNDKRLEVDILNSLAYTYDNQYFGNSKAINTYNEALNLAKVIGYRQGENVASTALNAFNSTSGESGGANNANLPVFEPTVDPAFDQAWENR